MPLALGWSHRRDKATIMGRELSKIYGNYFKNPATFDELNLVESGEVKLHWANWDTLLMNIRERIQQGDFVKSMEEVDRILESHKTTPVWIFNKKGQVKSNLYELYCYFLDPRLKELWFELNEDTLISFKGPQGPCIRLQSMRWFETEVYKTFVFMKLLTADGISKRSFRLSVDIPLQCEFEDSILEDIEMNIVQLSKNGMLIKVSSLGDLQKLKESDHVKFTANFSHFKRAKGADIEKLNEIFKTNVFKKKSKNLTEFTINDNILNLRSNRLNTFFANGGEYHLFINFKDINDTHRKGFRENIKAVVGNFEDFASQFLKQAA